MDSFKNIFNKKLSDAKDTMTPLQKEINAKA